MVKVATKQTDTQLTATYHAELFSNSDVANYDKSPVTRKLPDWTQVMGKKAKV